MPPTKKAQHPFLNSAIVSKRRGISLKSTKHTEKRFPKAAGAEEIAFNLKFLPKQLDLELLWDLLLED